MFKFMPKAVLTLGAACLLAGAAHAATYRYLDVAYHTPQEADAAGQGEVDHNGALGYSTQFESVDPTGGGRGSGIYVLVVYPDAPAPTPQPGPANPPSPPAPGDDPTTVDPGGHDPGMGPMEPGRDDPGPGMGGMDDGRDDPGPAVPDPGADDSPFGEFAPMPSARHPDAATPGVLHADPMDPYGDDEPGADPFDPNGGHPQADPMDPYGDDEPGADPFAPSGDDSGYGPDYDQGPGGDDLGPDGEEDAGGILGLPFPGNVPVADDDGDGQ